MILLAQPRFETPLTGYVILCSYSDPNWTLVFSSHFYTEKVITNFYTRFTAEKIGKDKLSNKCLYLPSWILVSNGLQQLFCFVTPFVRFSED